MKRIVKIISLCAVAVILAFGFGACIAREQSAVGIATAIWERNGGAEFGWTVYPTDVAELESYRPLGWEEARRHNVVAMATLIREDLELSDTLDRTMVMAYVWEFASTADARGFIAALNADTLLFSQTNVYRGRFALSGLRYPAAEPNDDGTHNIYIIRESRNDYDDLVGKFRWAVR